MTGDRQAEGGAGDDAAKNAEADAAATAEDGLPPWTGQRQVPAAMVAAAARANMVFFI